MQSFDNASASASASHSIRAHSKRNPSASTVRDHIELSTEAIVLLEQVRDAYLEDVFRSAQHCATLREASSPYKSITKAMGVTTDVKVCVRAEDLCFGAQHWQTPVPLTALGRVIEHNEIESVELTDSTDDLSEIDLCDSHEGSLSVYDSD